MNITRGISTIHDFNSSHYFDGNETKTDFEMSPVVYIICILIGLPTHLYVIWLIVRGTGNGLAAEIFILNLSVCDIILCVQTLLILLCNTFEMISSISLGYLDGVLIIGHPSFECLICVERYLAVVHPVTFLKYKPLRYKLMCSAVVWMAAFASGGFSTLVWLVSFSLYFIVCLVPFFLLFSIQLFCCLAVLRALKQSGPGERGREREEENFVKRRAFYFILISTVATVIIYVAYLSLIFLPTAESGVKIKMSIGQFCFVLAGLVQPVFFLYRVRKLNFKCQ